jgi:cell division protein FtsN
MVQVGAFSTPAAANAVSQQVTKAGYSATVVAGKILHRVLIQAGPTREDALTLATQMSQNGFRGAFIVPPRQ